MSAQSGANSPDNDYSPPRRAFITTNPLLSGFEVKLYKDGQLVDKVQCSTMGLAIGASISWEGGWPVRSKGGFGYN